MSRKKNLDNGKTGLIKNTVYISTQDVAFNAHVSKKHYTEDTALPN